MTADSDFKRRVRERMARTGERYTAARAALLGTLGARTPPRARHDQTFALSRALAAMEIVDPRTDAPYSEAWLLGLGGGISAQVNTFVYEGADPTLYVGTRCNPQYAYTADFVVRAAEALGLQTRTFETGGAKTARSQLQQALQTGPALVWVGREALLGVPERGGATPWVVLVDDAHDGGFHVRDCMAGTLEVPEEQLLAARGRLRKAKHRVVALHGTPRSDPRKAVPAAVRTCLDDLAGKRVLMAGYERNFGLIALDRWRDDVRASGKRGWRARFAPGRPLMAGCRFAYLWIERVTGGGGFRPLYADFLQEAGHEQLAATYRELGSAWTALADRMCDPGVPLLAELRRAMTGAQGPLTPAVAEGLLARADAELPPEWAEALYDDLADRLQDLAQRERQAAERLQAAVS
ncbi:MAG: BtrH N-terminal domain-containing protein [Myxococcales bacterium]|nr:BtrH N-terminal domain-containing protein [Myxococcales bacterium]